MEKVRIIINPRIRGFSFKLSCSTFFVFVISFTHPSSHMLTSRLISLRKGLIQAPRQFHGLALAAEGHGQALALSSSGSSCSSSATMGAMTAKLVGNRVASMNLLPEAAMRGMQRWASFQNSVMGTLESMLGEVVWNIKRTFQPSLLRRKRKHGFLHRVRTRHGRAILARRRRAGKTRLCA